MTAEHWVLVAVFTSALGAQVALAEHWHDVITPPMVGAVLVQVAAFVRALYTDRIRHE